MEEPKLLIFRSGMGEYGIPVEEVSGIIASTEEKKSTILSHVNGVQIMIIADEIIQEKKLINKEAEEKVGVTVSSLQIWNFK